MVWAICGAGRGVGKTHVAMELLRVLPDSVYAKCGRGRRQPGKPDNFFIKAGDLSAFLRRHRRRRHLVVESGRLARQGGADISIYVAGPPGRADRRKDADSLRAACDIYVGPRASENQWRRVLERRLGDARARRAVRQVLARHKQYLRRPGPAVRSKIWFVAGGRHAFGAGLAGLLSGIDRRGSLRAAAAEMGISYRRAWGLIRSAEEHLGARLIEARPGGAGGGGSALAPKGRHLLKVFGRLQEEVVAFANRRFAALYERESADG